MPSEDEALEAVFARAEEFRVDNRRRLVEAFCRAHWTRKPLREVYAVAQGYLDRAETWKAQFILAGYAKARRSTECLEEAFAEADRLQAAGQGWYAQLLLGEFEEAFFFSEELHERLGWLSFGSPDDNGPEDAPDDLSINAAGENWWLSPGEQPIQEKARALVRVRPSHSYMRTLYDYSDPMRFYLALFHNCPGPELPFAQFSSPAVRRRLRGLQEELAGRGIPDAELRRNLIVLDWPGEPSPPFLGPDPADPGRGAAARSLEAAFAEADYLRRFNQHRKALWPLEVFCRANWAGRALRKASRRSGSSSAGAK